VSGIFGVADPGRHLDVGPLTNKMADAMSHRSWYVAEHFADQAHHLALGRIGVGIFNQTPQPVWNADHTIALVMAGELYNPKTPDKSDERVALDLYERMGERFASELNGVFVIAIWDGPRNQLLIANDRFGLYPLYYTCRNGRLVFAPEIKGCLCDDTFPRKLDLTALAQYMRFQHLLGERTFFEDLRLLPPASVLTFDLSSAKCSLKTYWTFDNIPYHPKVTFDEAVEETGILLRRAVQQLSGDSYRPGVYLSGGLDSRTILGLVDRRPIVSVTYGHSNCRDVHYARRIARAVGSDHHWFDLPDGKWVEEYANLHLTLTEGFHSWLHAHGISTLPQARELMDVNLTGLHGEELNWEDPVLFQAQDDLAFCTRLFHALTHGTTWPSIDEAEEKLLYSPRVAPQMRGLAFDSLCAELAQHSQLPFERRTTVFSCSVDRRFFLYHAVFDRSYTEQRFPFYDYRYFEFVHALPPGMLFERRLRRGVVQQETPRLACIPYDHDELLPTSHRWVREAHALTVKLKRRFNRHLWPIFPEWHTLYADYENYLRTDLKEWGESILFDQRTLDRGIFAPEFLRSIWLRHQSGKEQHTIGKIAPIMTYEKMLRRFVD